MGTKSDKANFLIKPERKGKFSLRQWGFPVSAQYAGRSKRGDPVTPKLL